MKNNKYAPYLLGPVVLLVWGLIFYRIYQSVYGEAPLPTPPVYQQLPLSTSEEREEGYELLVNYTDPFLGKNFQTRRPRPSERGPSTARRPRSAPKPFTPRPAPPPPPAAKAVPFPKVRYQGFQIMERDTIALLRINDRFYPIVRRGEVIQDVLIRRIAPDSVHLSFEGRHRAVVRGGR